ncbi:MAG: endonuclease/exonuclease/phosphatase family protein, partial [Puniceicoccales bacterium]|nr:endonuclease/exonuclease/phosphatase family protein [Puniceicoccales bacterium]
MKIVSWNVNGLRAILAKDFAESIVFLDPDILCLQEIKVKPEQLMNIEFLPQLSFRYFHAAERPGYSGTAVFSKLPLNVFGEKFSTENALLPTTFAHIPQSPDTVIEPQEGRVQ